MRNEQSFLGTLFAAGCILILIAACAKPYHFYVKYDLPEPSVQLTGQKVNLQLRDGRNTKNFLSESAKNEFNMWDGSFALYHTTEKPKGETHTLSLTGLLAEAMKKRLETMGISVVEGETEGAPLFELTLNKLLLDLKDRTWMVDFSYEVKLTRDNQNIGREKVSGKAERTKIMGRGAGEILVGDIFTESINNLDVEKLFKGAGIE